MLMKKFIGIISLATAFLSVGCANAEPLVSQNHPQTELTAWVADWDAAEGLKEAKAEKKKLAAVVAFAANYDENDKLAVSKEVQDILLRSRKLHLPVYLSVVNDISAEGKLSPKDTGLLHRLFASDDSMDGAIGDIIAAAKSLSADGIELDYEAFWKDEPLAKKYMDFTYRLIRAANENGLALRIVLEPSAAFDAGYVAGPTYVVMLYNLYGKHSGPGAKADREFIENTLQRFSVIPGKKGVALATGGCRWDGGGILKRGQAAFITEAEAVSLAQKHKVTPERDEESAALKFTCEDAGKATEVWYADAETMNAWITLAANAGITDVSLWRLGGNVSINKVKR